MKWGNDAAENLKLEQKEQERKQHWACERLQCYADHLLMSTTYSVVP